MNCQKCHAIAGAGGQVGPGLESIGASAQPDYLVDSLLEPGKAVKENYHALVVATSDGKVYTGIKLRQTDSELVLRDAEDREVAIPVSSIEEQKTAGSLMPAGLTEALTRPELIDLVRFLSQLGKIGPYCRGDRPCTAPLAGPGGNPGTEVGGRQRRPRGRFCPESNRSSGGRPTRRRAGSFPSRNGPTARCAGGRPAPSRGAGQLEVTSPGKVKLSFNSADALCRSGSTAGASSRRATRLARLILDLTRGLHTIAVAVDLARAREGIRCVLEDVPGSPAGPGGAGEVRSMG